MQSELIGSKGWDGVKIATSVLTSNPPYQENKSEIFFFLLMRLPVRELNVRLEPWPLFLAHKRVDYREIWQTILDMQSNGITLLKNPWVRSFWCKDSQNVEKGKRDWGMFFRKRKGKKPVFFSGYSVVCSLFIWNCDRRSLLCENVLAWHSSPDAVKFFCFLFFFTFCSNKRNRDCT